jgi:hypothetical protein
VGGRTIKTGQSRWFVGYKKHTLRLCLSGFTERVVLVPLVSWLAPGNRGEALFLRSSVRYCAQSLNWLPDFLAGDMAYINLKTHQEIRQRWNVAVVTKLRADMNDEPLRNDVPALASRIARDNRIAAPVLPRRNDMNAVKCR